MIASGQRLGGCERADVAPDHVEHVNVHSLGHGESEADLRRPLGWIRHWREEFESRGATNGSTSTTEAPKTIRADAELLS